MKKKEVFADIKSLVVEKTYSSKFNFEKYNISDKDKKYIIEREEIILENAQKHAKSLYEICKAIYEIKIALKGDESQSFREWYTQNGLNKDKVSELTKRYELYIQAPDRIEFITNLSIPAVKELTKKNIDIDIQIDAIEQGLSGVEDIKEFVSNKVSVPMTKKKKDTKHIDKIISFYESNIKKDKIPQELTKYKKEIQSLKKYLEGLENKIELWEEEKSKENNLKFKEIIEEAEIVSETSKVYMSENNNIFTIEKVDNYYIIVYFLNENDKNSKKYSNESWNTKEKALSALEKIAQTNKWVLI